MRLLARRPCLFLGAGLVILAMLPVTFSVLESLLLDYGEARLAIGIRYPIESTRIVAAVAAIAVAAGVCLAWGERFDNRRMRSIAALGTALWVVTVMVVSAAAINSMNLEYYPNRAANRWFGSVGGTVLLTGLGVAAIRRTRRLPPAT